MTDWLLNLKSWTPRLHELANTNAASVFLVLVAHSDMSGHARPSVRTIGRQAGITARSVYNCLSLLKKVGAIQRVADSGKRKAVTYSTGFVRTSPWVKRISPEDPHVRTESTSCTPHRGPREDFVQELRGPRTRYNSDWVLQLASLIGEIAPVKNPRHCQSACKRFLSRGGTYQKFCQILSLAEARKADGKARSPDEKVGLILHLLYSPAAWQEALSGQFSSARAEKFNKRFAPQLAVLRGVSPGVKGVGDVLASLGFAGGWR